MSTPARTDAPAGAAQNTIVLPAKGGRRYEIGGLTALFKADEADTDCRYSISEWILEPGHPGVGAHSHEANDEIFYVLEGAPEILIGETWTATEAGAFLRVPADVTHDFRNPGTAPARLLNVFIPGGFERNMPDIVAWFASGGKE